MSPDTEPRDPGVRDPGTAGAPDVGPDLSRWHLAPARTRLSVSAGAGIAVGVIATTTVGWKYGLLAGWDASAVVYLAWVWATIRHQDTAATAAMATREDPSHAASNAVLLAAAVASLLSVGLVLFGGTSTRLGFQNGGLVLTFASVALSWAVVHTSFCLHYARLYYTEPAGGVEFNQDAAPTYLDFAYLAFTIGMTYQVSDTNICSAQIRRAALQHALLSFVFGTVILSVSINLVVSLAG